MKCFFLLCRSVFFFLLFSFTLNAQVASLADIGGTVNTDYATEINNVFVNLDKTKIPHKLLIDYAMEFTDLSAYDGVSLTSQNTLHRGHYTSIYNTLLMARVQAGVTGLVSPSAFRNNWNNLREANTVVLSGLFFKYNQFKTNAAPNYLTITNNKPYDKYVNGVWQNPYDEKQVFAMAAPILKFNNLTVKVKLPAALWYSNQSATVQNIAVDFSNGAGYQAIAFDQLKTATYTQAGTYEWKYRLTLTNGQVLYSHSKIVIDGLANTPVPMKRGKNEPCSLVNNIDQVEFTGVTPYQGVAGNATLQIKYAANDCIIRKPLIIAEGFDTGLSGVENPLGESYYENFKSSTYYGTALPQQLALYDVIYINWNDGKDYLQRNAYLLEDIIKWVNTQKQGTTPNVVLGQSMGGVIARYALRHMENQFALTQSQTWNHQTSLYISHDAPHQGANIPVSILSFARHLADQFIGTPLGDMNINPNDGSVTIEDLQALLNAPGTKQLLINNITSTITLDNSISSAWQTELRNMGYPQQTRNIAISNGSHCAAPQYFNTGDVLFSLSGYGKTSILTDFLSQLLGPLNGLAYISLAVLFNEPGLIIGVLPGNSKFNMSFNAKALPAAGTSSQVYKGKITFTKKLFWLLNITITLTDRSYTNPSNMLSYDYYPGGRFESPFNFENSAASGVFGSFGITAQAEQYFNFIPTPSALDIGRGNVSLNDNDYFVKYKSSTPPTAPKDSPFVNFTTSYTINNSQNDRHISFNTNNANWLAAELNVSQITKPLFDCTFVCAGGKILGPEILCDTATFTVPGGGGSYNWTLTEGSAYATISGNGTNTIVLTKVGSSTGKLTLSITGNSSTCGSATFTKTIWVGKPGGGVLLTPSGVPYDATNVPDGCPDGQTRWKFTTNQYPQDKTNQMEFVTPNGMVVTKNMVNGIATVTADELGMVEGQTMTISLRPVNSCGYQPRLIAAKLYRPTKCQCGIGVGCNLPRPGIAKNGGISNSDENKYYAIYPNPAKDVINIALFSENIPVNNNSEINAVLYDMMGKITERIKITDNQATLNVQGLAKGIYILRITIDRDTESHKVIIE